MLELRKATLESEGYSVKLASSGYAALQTLDETSVAVVLLEYKQEGMDAEAVAHHIKQRFPNLPIIPLSAFSEMPQRILWLVAEERTSGAAGGEYRTSAEDHPTFHRTSPAQGSGSMSVVTAPLAWQSVLCLSGAGNNRNFRWRLSQGFAHSCANPVLASIQNSLRHPLFPFTESWFISPPVQH